MEIQKSSAPLVTPSSPKNLYRLLSQLQPGHSLDAVVTAKLAENSFVLKLSDGQLLRAQTPNVLELGQILKLEVVKAGTVPELKIIIPEERSIPPEQVAVTQALRQFLPKQQSLVEFAVSLRQFAALTAGKPDAVSVALHDALGALLPRDELMSAEGLKRGVGNSGVFLEAKLANSPVTLQGDLKGHLLALAGALQKVQGGSPGSLSGADIIRTAIGRAVDAESASTSPDFLAGVVDKALLTKTEGAVARIVLDQLASLPQNDGKQSVWQIEIPFTDGHHTDAVKLKISREGKARQSGDQPNWSVVLELNPPGLGTLHSRISLVGEVIDTYFWSDRQTTAALVRDHLELLFARYAQAGLTVGQLNALEGTPTPADSSGRLLLPALLDERA